MKSTTEIIDDGRRYEAAGELDKAYEAYCLAAEAGDAEGMFAVGNLYFHKKYKGIPKLQSVMFPWQKQEYIPDLKTAFSWFLKAAEAGSVNGMSNTGVMLYQGMGCQKNDEASRGWLRKAAEAGHPFARKALKDFFGEQLQDDLSDADYDKLLDAFCALVDQGDMEKASKCYMILMNGTDDQLCRLGLQLAVGQYNKSLAYREFPYPSKKNGRSCAPVSFMRVGWESWLVVNLAAFPNGTATLGFASDISQGLYPIAGVQYGKSATYHATEFGWLGGKREAHLLHVGPWKADEIDGNLKKMIWCESDLEKYQQIIQRIDLQPNEALFAENGEKEFSVEITWVENNTAQVLCRYTIGAPDQGKDHLAQVSDFCLL